MSVTIVIPTIDGRADLLERCLDEYQSSMLRNDETDYEILVIRGHYRCNTAWGEGVERSTKKYVHLGNDDMWPLDDRWYPHGREAADQQCCPRPIWWDQNGKWWEPGQEPEDWSPAWASGISFFTTEHARTMLPYADLHYFSDNWLTAQSLARGWRYVWRTGYRFLHHLYFDAEGHRIIDPTAEVEVARTEDWELWERLKVQPDIAEFVTRQGL